MKYFLSDILSMVIRAEWHNHPDYQRWDRRSGITRDGTGGLELGCRLHGAWKHYMDGILRSHRGTGNAAH